MYVYTYIYTLDMCKHATPLVVECLIFIGALSSSMFIPIFPDGQIRWPSHLQSDLNHLDLWAVDGPRPTGGGPEQSRTADVVVKRIASYM